MNINKELIKAFAISSGYSEENLIGALEEFEDGRMLTGWIHFRKGWHYAVEAVAIAINESQPPSTTPWDCVDAVRAKLEI